MARIVFTVWFVVFGNIAFAQLEVDLLNTATIKNERIKSITYVRNSGVDSGSVSHKSTYNQQGLEVRWEAYDNGPNIKKWKYDSQGNNIEYIYFILGGMDSSVTVYTYDTSGLFITSLKQTAPAFRRNETMELLRDSIGLVYMIIGHDSVWSRKYHTDRMYDEFDRLWVVKDYDNQEKLLTTILYEYFGNSQKVKRRTEEDFVDRRTKVVIEYNRRGRIVSSKHWRYGNPAFERHFRYGHSGCPKTVKHFDYQDGVPCFSMKSESIYRRKLPRLIRNTLYKDCDPRKKESVTDTKLEYEYFDRN